MKLATNAPLSEIARYATVPRERLLDVAEQHDELLELLNNYNCDDVAELTQLIDELQANQENPDHGDYDDLKSFFDDCVESLNSRWPCAEAYDQNLRDVITSAIARGDVEEEELK